MPALRSRVPSGPHRSNTYLAYVLILFTIVAILNAADRQVISVLMPFIKADLGASDTVLGFIAGPAVTIPHILLGIPLARLADRWSRRKVLAIAVATWSIFTSVSGLAANMLQLALARVAVGVGESGGTPGIQSMIAELFPASFRSTALGIYSTSAYLGVLVGMLGGAALGSYVGWRAAFFWLGVPGVLMAALCWWTLPRRGAAFVHAAESDLKLSGVLKLCWERRTLRYLALGAGTFSTFGLALATWMPSYFMRSHGMSVMEAGAWMGLLAITGGVIGTVSSGMIVDRLSRRDLRWQLRIPAIGFFAAIPLYVAQLLWPSEWVYHIAGVQVPGVVLFSFPAAFLSALYPGPFFAALVSVVPAAMRSQAVATIGIVVSIIGAAIGPLFAGSVSDYFSGTYGDNALRYALLSMTIMVLLAGLLFWRAASHYVDEKVS
jgi:MFS family permease